MINIQSYNMPLVNLPESFYKESGDALFEVHEASTDIFAHSQDFQIFVEDCKVDLQCHSEVDDGTEYPAV